MLVIDGKGGLSVLSRYDGCNVGGIGCELNDVKYYDHKLTSLTIPEYSGTVSEGFFFFFFF